MTMRKMLALVAVVVASIVVTTAPAATQLDLDRCLKVTTTTGLRINAILNDLGLTPDQVRDLRSRLVSYSPRAFEGLDGLGLTPEQQQEIQRRIDVQVAAMNRYPLGWPCKPFTNPSLVVGFMKAKLISNGYRPSMSFRKTSPRQFQFRAIQDGTEQFGVVVKTGPRQITVSLQSVSPQWGRTYKFTVSFEA